MLLTVEHHHLRSNEELDSLVENRVLALQPRLQIDQAIVRLEYHHEHSPACRVRIHLVTPGPDVVAERSDHTIRAAIDKVLSDLETKISGRTLQRKKRVRSNLQSPVEMRSGRRRR